MDDELKIAISEYMTKVECNALSCAMVHDDMVCAIEDSGEAYDTLEPMFTAHEVVTWRMSNSIYAILERQSKPYARQA